MKKIVRIVTIPRSFQTLLKDQLKEISKKYEVIAIANDEKELYEIEKEQQIRVKAISLTRKITPIKDIIAIFKMYVFLKKEKPFIVHSHTPKAGLVGMIAAYVAGVPNRIHTIAGLPLEEAKGLKRNILLITEKLTYMFATKVLPNSKGLYNYVIDHNLIAENKLQIIANGTSNGIDLEYFNLNEEILKASNNFKSKYHIEKTDIVFLFIGRIVKDKGINELVEAFDKLSQIKSNVKLLLVGRYEQNLNPISQKSINIIKSNDKIIECGFQKDVRPFLNISDVFVLPSYREGFPNVVLQSLSFNVPTIITNINGANEVIVNNVNGIIVSKKNKYKLYDAMYKMMDEKFRKKLQKNCRATIENKYEQQYVINELIKFYEGL